jgi:hypothetical protein
VPVADKLANRFDTSSELFELLQVVTSDFELCNFTLNDVNIASAVKFGYSNSP